MRVWVHLHRSPSSNSTKYLFAYITMSNTCHTLISTCLFAWAELLRKKNQCNQYTTMLSCTLKEKNTLGLYGLIRTQAIYLTDLKSKISRKDTRISCLYLLHRYTMFQKLSYNGNLKTICVLSFSQKYLVI